ncbi:MAG: hypothetical protein FWG96_06525 [Methanomassiliicoccaceae archaeon]|nr:hypothetical protein [Methanomassiliicoccaceae archaeon]
MLPTRPSLKISEEPRSKQALICRLALYIADTEYLRDKEAVSIAFETIVPLSILTMATALALALIALMLIAFRYSSKYVTCRKEAFSAMKKARVIIYAIPLFLSVLFVIIFYRDMVDYGLAMTNMHAIFVGAFAGILLFDVFESKEIKSRSENRMATESDGNTPL